MFITKHLFVFSVFLGLCLTVSTKAQVTGAMKLPKPGLMKPGEYDTTAVDKAELMAKETLGMVETSINPDTYIVGPNDILTVFIAPIVIKPEAPTFTDIPISPDGRIVIPGVGAVKVGGLTLTEAENIVKAKVLSILKSPSVSLSLRKMRTFKVIIRGAVRKPGIIPATPSDRVSEIIDRVGGLMYDASMRSITINRQVTHDAKEEVIPVDLQSFYYRGIKTDNPFLNGGDVIYVPVQSKTNVFEVNGEVGKPGTYEFKEGETFLTALQTAGGLLETARLDSIEIARFDEKGKIATSTFIDGSDVPSVFNGNPHSFEGDFVLRAGDRISIRPKLKWRTMHTVAITGEVEKPGRYAINPDSSTIFELIQRAGGFTKEAYPESSLLIRQNDDNNVYDIEYWRLAALPPAALSEREKSFMREKKREVRGLIAVDFTKKSYENSNLILTLEDQDSVHISRKKDFVNVFGKVQNPGRIKFNPQYSFKDYIAKAGGFSTRADEDETVILKQRGEQFIAEDDEYTLQPGDQILVPEIPESTLTFTQILSMALTITAQIITVVGVIYTLSRPTN